MKYTDVRSNITFNDVKAPTILVPGVLGRLERLTFNSNLDKVTQLDNKKPFINAIDIDWNGAEIELGIEINTTANLLEYIKNNSGNGGNGHNNNNNYNVVQNNYYKWYSKGIIPSNINNINELEEDSWTKNYASNRPNSGDVLWMCLVFISGEIISIKNPILISGEDGLPGKDNTKREYIYKLFPEILESFLGLNNPYNWSAVLRDDYTGPTDYKWEDDAQSVSKDMTCEYVSYRDKEGDVWGKFSLPVLWAHFGKNGFDGGGVEYAFIRTSIKEPPVIIHYVGEENLECDEEYLPVVLVASTSLVSGNKNFTGGSDFIGRCTDDPVGVDNQFPYEWVVKRKFIKNSLKWESYYGKTMSLWGIKGLDGTNSISLENGVLTVNGESFDLKTIDPGNAGTRVIEISNINETSGSYYKGQIGIYLGSLYIWTGSKWISIGQTEITPGSGTLYAHIAYADSIEYKTINGEKRIKYVNFTKSSGDKTKKWMGICVNGTENEDPGPSDGSSSLDFVSLSNSQGVNDYKWQYTKGFDGNGVEFIYCLTDGTKPGISTESYNGINGDPSKDEFYPKISGISDSKIHSSLGGLWSDDPVDKVSKDWPKLWWASRKKVNGLWSKFGKITPIETYSEGIAVDYEIFYKWSDEVPNDYPPENDWSKSIHVANIYNKEKLYYMGRNLINGVQEVDTNGDPKWDGPTEVNPSGEDGTYYEFIYLRSATPISFSKDQPNDPENPATWDTVSRDKYLGPNGSNWTDHPLGIGYIDNTFYKYEYASIRVKTNGVWNLFVDPFPWSVYGDKGTDGDGVEYIYKAFSLEQTWITGANHIENPANWNSESAVDKNGHNWSNSDYIGPESAGWNDDPVKLDDTDNKFEYVSVRRKVDNTWRGFSKPELWANISTVPGPTGRSSVLSTMFVRFDPTNNKTEPDLPAGGSYDNYNPSNQYANGNSSNIWQDGIPAVGDDGQTVLWLCWRRFTSDGVGQDNKWMGPTIVTDTETYDVEFSPELNPEPPNDDNRHKDNNPSHYGLIWFDPVLDSDKDFSNMIWRAERTLKNKQPVGDWVMYRIKGESAYKVIGLESWYYASSSNSTIPAIALKADKTPATNLNEAVTETGIEYYIYHKNQAENPSWDSTNKYLYRYDIITLEDNSKYGVGPVFDKAYTEQGPQGESTWTIVCDPSTVVFRRNVAGDLIILTGKDINFVVKYGNTVINKNQNHEYIVGNQKLYLYTRKIFTNRSTNYEKYTGNVVNTGTNGIDSEYTNYGYLESIEFCLSTANSDLSVSSNNTIYSCNVGIECEGRIGSQGILGPKGRYNQYIYKNSKSNPGTPSDSEWSTTGWSTTATTPNFAKGEYTWCSTREVTHDANNNPSYGSWLPPYRITGDNGKPGEDGDFTEFIYTRNNTGIAPSAPPHGTYTRDWPNTGSTDHQTVSNYVDGQLVYTTWYDNPQGVQSDIRFEYVSSREYDGVNKTWSDYSPPSLWAKYGENGRDGDGIEYVFIRTISNSGKPTIVHSGINDYNYSSLDVSGNPSKDKYLPLVQSNNALFDLNLDNKITIGNTNYYQCTDNPQGVTSTYKYEWVAIRKKKSPNQDGTRDWDNFGEFALWSNWTEGLEGVPGKMFYSMGTWNNTIDYEIDDLRIPMVFYNDGVWNEALGCYGSYYYLKKNTDHTANPQQDPTNTEYWEKATNYGLVMTQGIFAEFAKFGSAIISGDYMFSVNGKFNGLDVELGNKLGDKPCYLFFNNENKNYEVTETLTQTLTPDNGGSNINSYTYNGSKLYLKQITINLNSETTHCDITNILNNNIYSSTSGKRNGITTFTVNKWIETGYKIKFTSYQGSISNAFNLNLIVSGDFVPNWMVDLKTGKMIASQGNFILNSDGTVDAGNGNFTIDTNGNVSIKGNINSGNIYSPNIFRSVCVSGNCSYYDKSDDLIKYHKVYYCGEDITGFMPTAYDNDGRPDPPIQSGSDYSETPSIDFKAGKYYSTEDFYYLFEGSKRQIWFDGNISFKETVNYFTLCTGDADIIIGLIFDNAGYYNNGETADIILPRPEDYKGKIIEILIYVYTNSKDPITRTVGCVIKDRMAYKFSAEILDNYPTYEDGHDDGIANIIVLGSKPIPRSVDDNGNFVNSYNNDFGGRFISVKGRDSNADKWYWALI